MIFYAEDWERWEDTEDPDFLIPMTPEVKEDCDKVFRNQKDFWRFYFGDEIALKIAGDYTYSCDCCENQEFRHYCLLRGVVIKNMDISTCKYFTTKQNNKSVKIAKGEE